MYIRKWGCLLNNEMKPQFFLIPFYFMHNLNNIFADFLNFENTVQKSKVNEK